MGRQTWASEPQTAWLGQRKKGFVDAQAAGTTRAFLNMMMENFITKWPMDPPTPAELLDTDGDVESAKKGKLDKRREQIEWWFRNRARPTATGTGKSSKGSGTILALTRKKTQLIAPYQSYLHLYTEKVMAEVPLASAAYMATKKPQDPDRHSMSFVQEVSKRLLDGESESVKSEVEAYRQKHFAEQLVTPITFEALLTEGVNEAQRKVQALQKSINLLARTGLEALKAVEDQTGFKGTLFLGGPNPETGQNVTLAIHNGTTSQLGNIWPEASEEWNTVQSSFDSFISRCFPPQLPKQLESLFNGETVDSTLPSTTTAGATPPAPTCVDPPLPNDATAAAQPSTATENEASAAITPDLMQAHSPASPRNEETSTSSHLPAMQKEKETPRLRQETPEPSYDDVVRARHAQNMRVWAVMDKRKVGADEARRIVEANEDLNEPVEEPEWIVEAREHLEGVSEEGWWRDLVKAWGQFEAALGYPDGGNHANRITAKSRPEEARSWINRARNYSRPPKISSLVNYVKTWRNWWHHLQPGCRQTTGDNRWPLQRVAPSDSSEWAKVRRGGCNGLFMVVLCLVWWFQAVQEDDGDVTELCDAAEDVMWVLTHITPTTEGAPATITSPSATTASRSPDADSSNAAAADAASAPSSSATHTAPNRTKSASASSSPPALTGAAAATPMPIPPSPLTVTIPASLPAHASPPAVMPPASSMVASDADNPQPAPVTEAMNLPPSISVPAPAWDPQNPECKSLPGPAVDVVSGSDGMTTIPAAVEKHNGASPPAAASSAIERPASTSGTGAKLAFERQSPAEALLLAVAAEGLSAAKRPAPESEDAPAAKKAKESVHE